MGRHRKLPGRWCWCCGGRGSNESFSRKRGVCRQCAKLGPAEIAYRQHLRNIDRLLTRDGRVPHTQQRTFAKYLAHTDPRVRAYAEAVRTWPLRGRAAARALQATAEAAEAAARVYAEQMDIAYEEDEEEDALDGDEVWEWEDGLDEELPF